MTDVSVPSFRELLKTARAELSRGLSDQEIEAVEERFGVEFNGDQRAFLGEVLPLGRNWPDWRSGDPDVIRAALDGPTSGVLFDVERNSFWPPSWGTRPVEMSDALALAAERLSSAVKLVPVWGHRYTPQRSTAGVYPVFSVVQTDVIYYGRDLRHYLGVEFSGEPVQHPRIIPRGAWTWPDAQLARSKEVAVIFERPSRFYVPFWSELAENRPDDL